MEELLQISAPSNSGLNNNDYGLNPSQTSNLLNNNETTPSISLVDTEINPLEFNEILGTLGRDEITGTEEDDLITGSYGKDIISGGMGIDIFVYTSIRDAGDMIIDFEPDQDLLDLNGVLGTFPAEIGDPVAEGYVIFDHYQGGADVLLDRDGLGPGRSRKYIQLQFAQTPTNQAPDDLGLDNNTVAENADGSVIGNVSVSDRDILPEFTNNVVTVSDDRFEVVDDDGTLELKLKDGQSLNYEVETSVTLTLTATDAGDSSLTYSEEFPINVINVNEAPDDLTLDGNSVTENQSGAVIGNVGVSDPDNVLEFTNNLVTVSDNRFEVVDSGDTLQLKLKDDQSLDFDLEQSVNLVLTATDVNDGSLTYSEEFLITVVEDEPVGTIRGRKFLDINDPVIGPELVINGDAETGDTTGWAENGIDIISGDQAIGFGFVPDEFEVGNFAFTGGAGPAGSQTLTQIIDISSLATEIDAGQITSLFSIWMQSRALSGVQDLAQTIVSFLNENGEVIDEEVFAAPLDNTWDQYTDEKGIPTSTRFIQITLDSSRSGGFSSDSFFDQVSLKLSNEENLGLAGVTIYLDLNNNAILDADEPFQITSEDDPNTPDLDETGQYEFTDVPVGNYVVREVVPSGFTQTAPSNGFYEVEVIEGEIIENIDFGNVEEETPTNQPPDDLELDNDTVEENADGAIIGNVSVSDPDTEPQFTNNIVTVSDSRFEVIDNSGTWQLKLQAGQSLNYEVEPTVDLTLTATDVNDSSLTYSEQFTIDVINVNEAPFDLNLDNNTVEENQLGAVIGNVGVLDPDNVPEFTKNLVTVDDDRFEVVDNGGTLQLKLKDDQSLDFETEPTVTVNLTATDAGDNSLTYSESFVIDVLDEPFRDIDLTGNNPDLGGVDFDGQNLTLSGTASVEIINLGSDATTKSFEVLFFEDSNANQIYDNGIENFLGTTQVDNIIESGASLIIEAQITGSVNFLGSPIGAFVDAQNLIEEPNESNNVTTTSQDCDDQGNQGGEFNPVIEWNKSSFSVLPNSNQVMMTPAVIDLNQDEIPDVVFSTFTGSQYTFNGKLRAISGADGSELWTVTDPAYEVRGAGGVAVGDIDNDNLPEIIAPHENGNSLIAFEHDGSFKWQSTTVGTVNWGSASLADLDQDGTTEIIIGSTVLNNQGNILWSGNTVGGIGTGNNGVGPLSLVADLDLDGSPEVVAGKSAYRADGSLYWNSSIGDGFPAVGNFDQDDFPEIVVVSRGRVYLLEHTGEIKWGGVSLPGGGEGGAPTIADVDGDQQPEIGVAGRNNYVVLETDGSVKWTSSTIDGSSRRTGSSVFDFEGDGNAEIIYGDEENLYIYNGQTGDTLYEFERGSGTTYEYPLIVDADADGNAEIVVVANNYSKGDKTGIYVIGDLNDTWVPTRQIWNQHTYHITNVNDDGTIPTVEANNWEIYNNYRLNTLTQGNINACPDLAMSFIRLEDNAGETTITARIGNGGTIFVNSGVNVAFYRGNPEQGGTLLGVTQTSTRLNPAEFEDISLTINESITLEEIWVVADDDGTGQGFVSESNEENNTYNYVAEIPD